MIFECSFWRAS